MYPVLFEIPGVGFEVPSFGVLVATGFLFGIWLWGRILAKYGTDPENDPTNAGDVAVWLLIGVIGGARLMYVGVETSRYLTADVTPAMQEYFEAETKEARTAALNKVYVENPENHELTPKLSIGYDFLHDPLKVFFVWEGGLVMFGGLFGAILLGAWAGRRRKMHIMNGMDTGLVAGFVGQSIGRWGCLLVGDDYGSVVPERFRDLPFPITLTVPSAEWLREHPKSLFDDALAGEVLWATQPWMSINALMVAGVAWLVLKRRRFYGQVTGVVLIHYSITRFLIEMFRGDDVRGVWFGGAVSTSQLVAVLGVVVGIVVLLRSRRSPLPPAPVTP